MIKMNQKKKVGGGDMRIKRLQNEVKKCEAMKKNQNQDFVFLGPIMTENGLNLEKWQFKFQGKQGTPLEGGFYDVTFTFPQDYPNQPPDLKFLNDFKHMHVYLCGDICLPLVSSTSWNINLTNYDVASAIYGMVHGTPDPKDRASDQMRELYEKQGKEAYEQHLRDQAKNFSKYSDFYISK